MRRFILSGLSPLTSDKDAYSTQNNKAIYDSLYNKLCDNSLQRTDLAQEVGKGFDLSTVGSDNHTILYHLSKSKAKNEESIKYVQEQRLEYLVNKVPKGKLKKEDLKQEVAEGFDLGTVDSNGNTILHNYLMNLNTRNAQQIIEYMLDQKKELLNMSNNNNQIPLDLLLQSKHKDKFQLCDRFIRSGNNHDIYHILVRKIEESKIKEADFSRNDVRTTFQLVTVDSEQNTILHHLARSKIADKVMYNIINCVLGTEETQKEILINFKNKEENTPLDLLLQSDRTNKFDIAELFMPHSINETDDQMNVYKILIKQLEENKLTKSYLESKVKAGFKLDTVDSNGNTILHYLALILPEISPQYRKGASVEERDSIIQYVLEQDKKLVNKQNNDGNTSLHLRLQQVKDKKYADRIQFINRLMQNGAKISISNNEHCNALDYIKGIRDLRAILNISYINATMNFAVSKPTILQSGINVENNQGELPLDIVLQTIYKCSNQKNQYNKKETHPIKYYVKLCEFLVCNGAGISMHRQQRDKALDIIASLDKDSIIAVSVTLLSNVIKKVDKINYVTLLQASLYKRKGIEKQSDINPDEIIHNISKDLCIMLPEHAKKTYSAFVNLLSCADFAKWLEYLQQVVGKGFELDTVDNDDNTVLHQLVLTGIKYSHKNSVLKCVRPGTKYRDIIQYILNAKKELVNHTNKKGNTPLHLLLLSERDCDHKVKILRLFVQNGANIWMKNNNGYDALCLIVLKETNVKNIVNLCTELLLLQTSEDQQIAHLDLLEDYLDQCKNKDKNAIITNIEEQLARQKKQQGLNFVEKRLDDLRYCWNKKLRAVSNFCKKNCVIIICVSLVVLLMALAVLNLMLGQIMPAVKLASVAVALVVCYVAYCKISPVINEAYDKVRPPIKETCDKISAFISASSSKATSCFDKISAFISEASAQVTSFFSDTPPPGGSTPPPGGSPPHSGAGSILPPQNGEKTRGDVPFQNGGQEVLFPQDTITLHGEETNVVEQHDVNNNVVQGVPSSVLSSMSSPDQCLKRGMSPGK